MRQSHGGSAFVRAFIALLAVALALAACAGETVPAPDSTGPVGALYGNVRAADGGPATDAKVHMFQLTREASYAPASRSPRWGFSASRPDSARRRSMRRCRPRAPSASRPG